MRARTFRALMISMRPPVGPLSHTPSRAHTAPMARSPPRTRCCRTSSGRPRSPDRGGVASAFIASLPGVHALPFLFELVIAVILAPVVLRTLEAGGHTKANYRDRQLPCPFGVLTPAVALLALIPLMLLQELASIALFHPETLPIAVYAFGILTLGLIDDTLGEERAGGAEQPA